MMRADECVHTARISRKLLAVFIGCRLQPLFGRRPDSQNALSVVVFQRDIANNFSKLAGRRAAHQVHLEKAVLCRDVSLREKQVIQSC